MTNDKKLYDWVFHFNPYEGNWNAIPREKYSSYWNNFKCPGVLRHPDINHLIKLIVDNDK